MTQYLSYQFDCQTVYFISEMKHYFMLTTTLKCLSISIKVAFPLQSFICNTTIFPFKLNATGMTTQQSSLSTNYRVLPYTHQYPTATSNINYVLRSNVCAILRLPQAQQQPITTLPHTKQLVPCIEQ